MEHHFKVEEAIKWGVEKAIILNNLRFWLEKNRANRTNVHEYVGKNHYWTYNSGAAFSRLFPYMKERTIRAYLKELEEESVIISGEFNKNKYDRTKWYSMPEYAVKRNEEAEVIQESVIPSAISANGPSENSRPIPDINPDIKHIPVSNETDVIELYRNFPLEVIEGITEETSDDGEGHTEAWLERGGRRLRPKEISTLIKAYNKRRRTETPKVVSDDYRNTTRFMDYYSNLCDNYIGVRPIYGDRDRIIINAGIKKYKGKIVEIAQWFMESKCKDTDKIHITNLVAHWVLNKYQTETKDQIQ